MLRLFAAAAARPVQLGPRSAAAASAQMFLRGHATDADANTSSSSLFRTSEQDARQHDQRHRGRIYSIPESFLQAPAEASGQVNPVFFPTEFLERSQLFQESSLMIRKPALEAFHYLKQFDWKDGNLKMVLYGKKGCGKTLTLSHIYHRLVLDDVIVLNFGDMRKWLMRYKEIAQSNWRQGSFDHIEDSRNFLINFAHVNKHKMEGLLTSKEYVWSEREKTPAGSPLLSVAEMGIDRKPFAADCLNVLLKELTLLCLNNNNNNNKLAILVDGINLLFEPKTFVHPDWPTSNAKMKTRSVVKKMLAPDDLSVIRNLKKLLGHSHKGSALICSVDETLAIAKGRRVRGQRPWMRRELNMVPNTRSDMPFHLLGEKGWEFLDPFIPIEVPKFSDDELDVAIDFYAEKKYIKDVSRTEAGRQEIRFLTGGHPGDFMEYSAGW